ncbi:MAG: hypothetical protein OXI38_07120 [Bacteroidota bacterium]|nr:hypothetical protein [Bacteroidota bacterium]
MQRVEPPPVSRLHAPVWNETRLLHTQELLQRYGSASGVEPAEQLEAFVEQHLAGLQPVARVKPALSQLSVRFSGGFTEGFDLWPDARSDTGTIVVTALQSALVGASATTGLVAEKPAKCPHSDRQALMIILGRLDVRPSRQTIPQCLIVQMTYSAFARLTGMGPQAAGAWLDTGMPLALLAALEITIHRTGGPEAGHFDLLRLLPGKDPALASELIIVGADMYRGSESEWMLPAVLIELAGQAARWSQQGHFPRRSILFALWSHRDALTEYLAQPYWPLDATHIIVHIGNHPRVPASLPVRTLRLPHSSSSDEPDGVLNRLREVVLDEAGGM